MMADVIKIRREDAQKLAVEMWKERGCGQPWETVLAHSRDAYMIFAIFKLAEMQDASQAMGSC